MDHVSTEIASQPASWRRAAALAAQRSAALPHRGERVAAVGCGTSWFMAMAYAALREKAGHGETDAYPASEFPLGRRYDRVLAITRSGTTTEVLDVLAALPGRVKRTVVTARALPGAVVLPFADERSVVQTRFATSALALLRASLGENLDAAIVAAEFTVDGELPVAPGVTQVTFLGHGWTVGLAHEAALKCREAAGGWAEAYPAMEYRHGPIAIACPGRAVWVFGEVPPGLAEDILATGAAFVHSTVDPMADLIRAQRLAVALAHQRGLDPDAPRHLTRSVVLR